MSKISIICTVKNGEATIKNTIESVLSQTLRDWEFIIVDDGSIDRTVEILKDYKEIDERIKIIVTTGIGRGRALNLAVNNTKGIYVVNIDADDLIHPNKLKLQYNVIKENPKYFLLSTDNQFIYHNENIIWENEKQKDIIIEDITIKNLIKNQVDHSSVMIQKSMLLNIGGYAESRKSQFDYELWLRAAFKGYKLGKINKKLVAKRIHQNQSFENKRFCHLIRSVRLQTYYILKSKRVYLLISPFARLILGVFPFRLRQKINDSLGI